MGPLCKWEVSCKWLLDISCMSMKRTELRGSQSSTQAIIFVLQSGHLYFMSACYYPESVLEQRSKLTWVKQSSLITGWSFFSVGVLSRSWGHSNGHCYVPEFPPKKPGHTEPKSLQRSWRQLPASASRESGCSELLCIYENTRAEMWW